eukprot:scaffold57646_cov51-Phaeocystis_antarctica.AAC.1
MGPHRRSSRRPLRGPGLASGCCARRVRVRMRCRTNLEWLKWHIDGDDRGKSWAPVDVVSPHHPATDNYAAMAQWYPIESRMRNGTRSVFLLLDGTWMLSS